MAELGHPERPIEHAKDDTLARDGFVRRLSGALINSGTKQASGVVVGITGQWGSGKSSILNLVSERLKADNPETVIVRFDPWLISGRNDLISSFINELLSQLKREESVASKLKSVVNAVSDYGQQLAVARDLFLPGAGSAASGLFGLVKSATTKREQSLFDLREVLNKALLEAKIPIIVLIDEVDRVEDSEIRAIAQLVRAVADFPSISYLLAYDADRVAEALGSTERSEGSLERGRSYLEKIVQLQLPLPLIDDASISRMIMNELKTLRLGLALEDNFDAVERLHEMVNIISGGVISTPRDVSRLIGTYHALRGMLVGEVDWVDLLGYSALLTKAPAIAARIKRDPGIFLAQTLTRRDAIREVGEGKLSADQRLMLATDEKNLSPSMKELLGELFPAVQNLSGGGRGYLNPINSRRALLTTLHLGLMPGSHGQEEVMRLLMGDTNSVAAGLKKAFDEDTLDDLIDRLDDLYLSASAMDHVTFWKGVAQFVRKPDCSWMRAFVPMNAVIRALSDVLFSVVQKHRDRFEPIARSVFTNLRNDGENELTAYWVRRHIFALGLFGQGPRDDGRMFFTKDQVEAIVRDMNADFRSLHLTGRLVPCRWDLQPVYTMVDAKAWDSPCRDALSHELERDEAADGLALMFFGAHYSTESSTIDAICNAGVMVAASKRRMASGQTMHESVRLAHERVIENLSGWTAP